MIKNDPLELEYEIFEKSPASTWYNCGRTINKHLNAMNTIISNMPPLQNLAGEEDAIIYVGGGKYWPGIVVGCRLMREIGVNLPIQVWYRGQVEKIEPKQVDDLNVELIDMDNMSDLLDDNRVPRGDISIGGWESKLYALTHTKYNNILFLDADAYLVNNPKELFELSKTTGMLFWQDLDRMENLIKWYNVWPEGRGNVDAIQGGQIFLNKEKIWPALYLCHWMCQHSDFYFKHMFGDQDCWRVAMAATKSPFINLGKADWVNTSFSCKYNSKPLVVHRCQGKLFRPSDVKQSEKNASSMQYKLPLEGRVFDLFADVLKDEVDHSVFDYHYKNKIWGDGSGSGSNQSESKPFVDCINSLVKLTGWKSCVDIGCGDGRVAQQLLFKDYVGFDVSPEALKLFLINNANKKAELLDCYKDRDKIPSAEVLLIRDVLHHWPNYMIIDFIEYVIKEKKWSKIICCQDRHQWHDKQDTYVGGYRALNKDFYPLNKFPFESIIQYLHKEIVYLTIDKEDR